MMSIFIVYWEKDAEDGTARKDETGKAKRRFMDAVREDMAVVEVTAGLKLKKSRHPGASKNKVRDSRIY